MPPAAVGSRRRLYLKGFASPSWAGACALVVLEWIVTVTITKNPLDLLRRLDA